MQCMTFWASWSIKMNYWIVPTRNWKMKSQILSRSYIQLENEIQILKSEGGEASSLCQFRRVGAMCLSVQWQNQIKISCALGKLALTFLRAIVANGLRIKVVAQPWLKVLNLKVPTKRNKNFFNKFLCLKNFCGAQVIWKTESESAKSAITFYAMLYAVSSFNDLKPTIVSPVKRIISNVQSFFSLAIFQPFLVISKDDYYSSIILGEH